MNQSVAHRSGKPARATAGEGECSHGLTLTGTHPTERCSAATLTVTVVGVRAPTPEEERRGRA